MGESSVNKDKVVGYIMLIAGIAIILYSLLEIYNIFTGQKQPIQLFTLSGISLDLNSLAGGNVPNNADLNQQLVEAEVINAPLNYLASILFMGFVSSIGYRIARVGTLLVRTIKIRLNQDNNELKITAK